MTFPPPLSVFRRVESFVVAVVFSVLPSPLAAFSDFYFLGGWTNLSFYTPFSFVVVPAFPVRPLGPWGMKSDLSPLGEGLEFSPRSQSIEK